MRWLGLQQQLAFFRGDFSKLRSLSETAVNQQRRAQRMENAANELAWHAQLESYLGNSRPWKPGMPFSTTSAVMPFSPLAGSVLT